MAIWIDLIDPLSDHMSWVLLSHFTDERSGKSALWNQKHIHYLFITQMIHLSGELPEE